ncbi:hypothetical protein LINGRAHAP2_LOCUS337 [Linum grandiflorum]
MPLVIQLKEIPYPYNTAKFCAKLVEPLGAVISADLFSKYPDGHGTRFVKCTVRINLLQSIAGRIQAVVPNQQPFWVYLRYEDLPTVCFICGMLGHGYKHCGYATVLPFNKEERGDWMLARPEGHKIKLQILRRWLLLNRKGSLRSLFLPFSILTSKYLRVLVQVQCKFRTHPLPIRLCCLLRNIPFVMVILALLFRVFLFEFPFPLTYLIFP